MRSGDGGALLAAFWPSWPEAGVTPIDTATNTPGPPIPVSSEPAYWHTGLPDPIAT